MPIDPNIPLGVKVPDQTASLSSLVGTANNMQALQSNAMTLGERQAGQQIFQNIDKYKDPDGNLDFNALSSDVMKAMPTTGSKYVTELANMQQQATAAKSAVNTLDDQTRQRVANVIATIPPNAAPNVVHGTLDALDKETGGRIRPAIQLAHQGYASAAQQGPQAVQQWQDRITKGILPQETQRTLNTPNVVSVDNGQQVQGINIAPGVPGYAQGGQVFSVQKQLPPTTPTVGPNNQPGYLGPQPQAQPGMQGAFEGNPSDVLAQIQDIKDPQERANAQAAFNQQFGASSKPPAVAGGGFVPSAAVPGANESKAASVGVMNDHWSRINAGAADAPVTNSLLQTIQDLAPKAITGTEAGKRAYWTGLWNALHLGGQPSGDMQKDTDLLQKSMAQLNLSTPATTDAMRTLVEAGRPHSTMSSQAIEDAVSQIKGQVRANMVMRNMLTPDKRWADATGDVSAYDSKRQKLESLLDPRIFQYESLPPAQRKAFISKQGDKQDLVEKAKQLETMGVFQ